MSTPRFHSTFAMGDARMSRQFSVMTRLLLIISLFSMMFLAQAGLAATEVHSKVEGQALIASQPLEPSSYEIYAKFLSIKGDWAEAADVLETGRIKAAPSAELLVVLGHVYEAQGLFARAESVTREALVLDPEHVPAHLRMGEIYFKLGWPKSGLESYRTAVALAPEDVEPKVRLVGGMLEAGLTAEAEEKCLEFISIQPEAPELWLALGIVFEKQDKKRQAFTTYGQVLTIDNENAMAYARQGKLFCEFNQFDAAEISCRKALELDDKNALAHAYLGIACSYLGQEEDARKHAIIAERAGLNMGSVWSKIGH